MSMGDLHVDRSVLVLGFGVGGRVVQLGAASAGIGEHEGVVERNVRPQVLGGVVVVLRFAGH